MRWLAAIVALLVALPASSQYLSRDSGYVYVSGNSNCAASTDLQGPFGDNGSSTGTVAVPGLSDGGFWYIIEKLDIPGLTLSTNGNNSLGGTGTANLACPFSCRDGTSDWRAECCSADDTAGDAECNAHNTGATCEPSTIYYLDPVDGLQLEPFSTVVLCATGNECNNANTTTADVIDTLDILVTGLLNYHRVKRVIMPKTIWPASRVDIGANTTCANLWDDSCDDATKGGNDCTNTLEDFAAQAKWKGRVEVDTRIYDAITLNGTATGAGTRHAAFSAEGPGGIHVNVWGGRKYDAPYILDVLNVPIFDTPPPTPQLVVEDVTSTTATIGFAEVVVDPDGDTLDCAVWAVEYDGGDGWAGSHLDADRVHNGFCVCRSLNGDVACPNCGDSAFDADCNVAGGTDDTTAHYWWTCDDAPVQPDGTTNNNRNMPDYYEITGAGTGSATIRGLAPATEYAVFGACMPQIQAQTTAAVTNSLLPSDIANIDMSLRFTTDP